MADAVIAAGVAVAWRTRSGRFGRIVALAPFGTRRLFWDAEALQEGRAPLMAEAVIAGTVKGRSWRRSFKASGRAA
jgi:hypothetical protein